MKKHYYALATICAVLVACNKEGVVDNEQEGLEGKTETITAVIAENVSTKTDYTISGTKATFAWSEGDVIGRLGRASNYMYANFTAEDGIDGETSGTFTGTSPATPLTYAIYPVNSANGANITLENSADLYITLPSTIQYNHSNPLKNIVPMMGKLSSTTFEFKPIVGVIGFHASNIPAAATSITLSPNSGKGMSGKSVKLTGYSLDAGGVGMGEDLRSHNGLARGWMDNDGTGVTLAFSAGSFTEGDFYFPVAPSYATGYDGAESSPYAGLTITVKAGDDVLSSVTTTSNIAVNRAQIVKLPNVTFPNANVSVKLSGTPDAISAYVSSSTGTIDKVCIAPLSTNTKVALDTAIPNNTSGTDITSATEGSPSLIDFSAVGSGAYYIGVKAFSGSSEVYTTILASPVYYITATDKGKLVKQHTMTYTNGTAGAMTYGTMTLTLSDDFTKGQVVLTDFDGLTSTSATSRLANDHTFFKLMKSGSTYWMGGVTGKPYEFTDNATNVYDGNTYYGILDGSSLTFAATTSYPLFNYSVSGNSSETAKIILFSNEGATSDAPSALSFTYDGTTLAVAEKYVVVRWVGYFYNGSTITNSGGYASGTYARDVSITL